MTDVITHLGAWFILVCIYCVCQDAVQRYWGAR